jgi:G6PDH family F420-dependent oxidoreductase
MVLCAYHASHEQFAPSALVHHARLAEQAGFTAVSSSEHLQPWSLRQGQSGFAWAWLGTAMQATSLPFSAVCAPGRRYHPMIIAQAAATLAELFHGRFRLALGSGEALNERVLGGTWPPKAERHTHLPATRPMRAGRPMSSGGPTSSRVRSLPSCGRRSNLRPSPATCVPKTWTPPSAFRLTRSNTLPGCSRTSRWE